MTSVDSIPIPGERVAPIAREVASSAKSVAGVLGFACVVLAIVMLTVIGEDKDDRVRTNSAERAGYAVGKALSVFIMAGLPR